MNISRCKCGTNLSSYHSLRRYKKNCQSTTTPRKTNDRDAEAPTCLSQPVVAAGQKRPISTDISTFNRAEFGTCEPAEAGPRNPKINVLFNEIINDNGQDMHVTSQKFLSSVAVKQTALPTIHATISNSAAENFTNWISSAKINRATKAISGSYS